MVAGDSVYTAHKHTSYAGWSWVITYNMQPWVLSDADTLHGIIEDWQHCPVISPFSLQTRLTLPSFLYIAQL